MRVWRVAHEMCMHSGFPSGPYTASLPFEMEMRLEPMQWAHSSNPTHRSPHHPESRLDGIAGGIEVCGFNSLYALNAWFEPEYRTLMDELGFQVFVYDVPDDVSRVGACGQAVFARSAAELISTEPLCTT